LKGPTSLRNCSYFAYYTNSRLPQKGENLGQVPPPAHHANHRKSNSCTEASSNVDLRTREYLTEAEVERLLRATKGNRWAHRDSTMILAACRHGLRASELTDLRWDQVDFRTATLHVRRAKQGSPSTQPILGDELRILRRLQREQEPSPFVFTSERGSPFTTAGFARMVERAGVEARLGFKTHPHMLRHACGFALATKGHDTRALQAYLGHKNIQHTVRYTELSPTRFKNFWRD
jgi:type 1 fimbriae regulatory protein FimB/type 1 fimbriae regulatory protein FimE